MPYVTLDGMQMYYEVSGHLDGPPLVLLHGFTGSGATGGSERLSALGRRYRLVVPDLRGHGRTDNRHGPTMMNHRQFARDVISFCDAIGVERAAFCGESTGSMLQLTLALEAPQLAAACIFSAGTYFFSDQMRAWWRTLTPESLIQLWFPDETSGSEQSSEHRATSADFEAMHTAMGSEHWRIVMAAWLGLADHDPADDFPNVEEVRTITSPFLILHGDRDFFFPVAIATDIYGMIPDAELCILPNCGHQIHDEHPDWLDLIAFDFLDRRYKPDQPVIAALSGQ